MDEDSEDTSGIDYQDITDLTGLLTKGDLEKMCEILTIMQEMSNRVNDSRKAYVSKYGGEGLDMRKLEAHFLKVHVEPVWGDDRLAKLFAHAIVTGNYLF